MIIPKTMDDDKMRIAIYFKTKRAYEMFMELINANKGRYIFITRDDVSKYLDLDVRLESFRTLIINYLVVLLGKGKFDKMSVWNNKSKFNIEQIETFYKDNEVDLKKLFETRNKVFAHFDNQEYDKLPILHFEIIEKCFAFLECVLIRGGK